MCIGADFRNLHERETFRGLVLVHGDSYKIYGSYKRNPDFFGTRVGCHVSAVEWV